MPACISALCQGASGGVKEDFVSVVLCVECALGLGFVVAGRRLASVGNMLKLQGVGEERMLLWKCEGGLLGLLARDGEEVGCSFPVFLGNLGVGVLQ